MDRKDIGPGCLLADVLSVVYVDVRPCSCEDGSFTARADGVVDNSHTPKRDALGPTVLSQVVGVDLCLAAPSNTRKGYDVELDSSSCYLNKVDELVNDRPVKHL